MSSSLPPKRPRTPPASPTNKRARTSSPSYSSYSKPIRFLILSDTHETELALPPPCDVLLHCGDLTDGSPASLRKALKEIGKIQAELRLVIAGNHEICLDKDYYLSEGGSEEAVIEARSLIREGHDSEASQNGIRFLEEGSYRFTLRSGASFSIYASPYTPAYGCSAFQYPSCEDRFNPTGMTPNWAKNVGTKDSVIPDGIDIVMTHGPPKYILDSTSEGGSEGCEHLRRAIERVRPSLHCFGHIHTGYGAQRIQFDDSKGANDEDGVTTLPKEWVGKNQAKRKGYASLPANSAEDFYSQEKRVQTLCINAAVVDDTDEPTNMPWVVDLDLDR